MTRTHGWLTFSAIGRIALLVVGIAWMDACTLEEDAPPPRHTADAVEADAASDSVVVVPPECGDGTCDPGEDCLTCTEDCACAGLAATPPMGWNSWNLFACDIDEALVMGMADAMVETGMKDVGYEYVNLDDCWQVDRDADGVIVADPERFPGGIAALADYVHAQGLKLGVYTCVGALTCEDRPGSFGHEAQDMATYAEWGVDFVKVDWCYSDNMDAAERYGLFRDGILASGREILLSICNWGVQEPWVWGPQTGQLWRTSLDIKDGFLPLMYNVMGVESLAAFAGPGRWNDPDMLEVGNGGMSDDLSQAHMGLWAMFAAPLIAGNDLRNMSGVTLGILTNPEVLAVDQDPAGLQAVLLRVTDDVRVYARPLNEAGLRAVLFFNTSQNAPRSASIAWSELGLFQGTGSVRDLFAREDLGAFVDRFEAEVPPTGAVMVTVRGTDPVPGPGISEVSEMPWRYSTAFEGTVARDHAFVPAGEEPGPVLSLGGEVHGTGLGVPGGSVVVAHLGGRCDLFEATVGLTGNAGPEGSVVFEVWGDGTLLWESDVLSPDSAPVPVQADVTGRRDLKLVTTPAGDSTVGDRAAWADARVHCE